MLVALDRQSILIVVTVASALMTLPSTLFKSSSCRAGKRMSTFVDCGVMAVVTAAISVIEAMARTILIILVL